MCFLYTSLANFLSLQNYMGKKETENATDNILKLTKSGIKREKGPNERPKNNCTITNASF